MSLINTIPQIPNRYTPLQKMRITAGADQRRGKVRHGAIDIGVPVGSPVFAIADAQIIKIRRDPHVYKKFGGKGTSRCGSQISLRWKHPGSPSGFSFATYCHLKHIAPWLKEGMWVKGGTKIATSGGKPGDRGSGNTTGPHLHLSMRLGDKGFRSGNKYAANPLTYKTFFGTAGIPPRKSISTSWFWPISIGLGVLSMVGIGVWVYKRSTTQSSPKLDYRSDIR